ncbi:MAG: acetylornithine deacetylase [Paracoccaceae bacterium]
MTNPADSREILARLIGFDTVSNRSNLGLIDWVEGVLGDQGVSAERVWDASGEKAGLIATIGPPEVPGLVLSGHTDVVPVAGQDWTSDPFEARLAEGRLHGRGAADMKGFLACCLAAVPAMRAAPLARPIHLVFSWDEEVGCLGVRPMLARISEWAVRPAGCIVGEPTEMRVVIGHKHKLAKRVTVAGRAAHSSLAPEAVNAVEYAARLIAAISRIGRRLMAEGARDTLYDVAHTTAHVGTVEGGTALNIVPESCSFAFEFRAIAEDDPRTLLAEIEAEARRLEDEMRAVASEARIVFSDYSHIVGLDTAAEAEIVALAKRLAGRNDHAKVAYTTEGGLFAEGGISTVVCGPGSIAEAHRADEWIALDQLAACDRFLAGLIAHCRR